MRDKEKSRNNPFDNPDKEKVVIPRQLSYAGDHLDLQCMASSCNMREDSGRHDETDRRTEAASSTVQENVSARHEDEVAMEGCPKRRYMKKMPERKQELGAIVGKGKGIKVSNESLKGKGKGDSGQKVRKGEGKIKRRYSSKQPERHDPTTSEVLLTRTS